MKEPRWIDEHDTLILHDRLLVPHGGAGGLRDDGLSRSALARPRQFFAYTKAPQIVDLAALYTAGIVNNHPFVDGNKRTEFLIGILFLELDGYRFAASEAAAANAVLALASGAIGEDQYADFLRANTAVPDNNGGGAA